MKQANYEIVRGRDKQVLENYSGNWDGCMRRIRELGGCYARKSGKQKMVLNDPEDTKLAFETKVLRMKKAFRALPEQMQEEFTQWINSTNSEALPLTNC
tara:strand:- start:2147 stop:2443 length:297 start_codon:yes stop_codon:yes gene_type:complete